MVYALKNFGRSPIRRLAFAFRPNGDELPCPWASVLQRAQSVFCDVSTDNMIGSIEYHHYLT